MKQLSTDVLIIGSGGAGLRAAIEARRQGVNVLLVSKGKLGPANCAALAGGVFRASQGEKGIAEHFQETLEAGRFLNNPALVRTLAADAWSAVKETEKFGIELLVEKGKVSIVARAHFLLMLNLMSRSRTAREHPWFKRSFSFLENFKVENDLIMFSRGFLPEKRSGYWVTGARMGLEPNRRAQKALKCESTFRYLEIATRVI